MKGSRISGLAAAALMASAASITPTPTATDARDQARSGEQTRQSSGVTKSNPSKAAEQNRIEKMFGFSLGGGLPNKPRRPGPGWTNRHVQRMAQKRRNVARHRAQIKGRRRK